MPDIFQEYIYISNTTESKQTLDLAPDAISFAELISFIGETHQSENQSEHIFKLSRTHTAHLKEKLLTQMLDLEAHKGKYEIMLPFKMTLLDSTARDQESDDVFLIRAVNIIRKEIFQKTIQIYMILDR